MNDLIKFLSDLIKDGFVVRQEGVDVFINDHKIGLVYFEEDENDEDVMLNKFDIIFNDECFSFSEDDLLYEDFTVEGFVKRTVYNLVN